MELVYGTLEVVSIARVDRFWFPTTCYEASQGSKEYFCRETCDYLNVNSFCHKADKKSYVEMYRFAACGSQT
jgi:hypothetical protein